MANLPTREEAMERAVKHLELGASLSGDWQRGHAEMARGWLMYANMQPVTLDVTEGIRARTSDARWNASGDQPQDSEESK